MEKKYKNEEDLNQGIQLLSIGSWKVRTLAEPVFVLPQEKQILETYAKKWTQIFNPEHSNWFRNEFGAPSCIIRFDYVVDILGVPHIFEIEDRPAGLEISAQVEKNSFQLFTNELRNYSEYASKPIGICISEGRMFNSDDFFWAPRFKDQSGFRVVVGEIPRNPENNLWLVRSLRNEEKYYSLSPYSLSTIAHEGDKSYGVSLGMWTNASMEVDWNKELVFKPGSGCRCENVHLWSPNRSKKDGGFSTRSKIIKAIENKDVQYVQNYYQPEKAHFLPENYSMIRRNYAVFSLVTRQYEIVGGQWEARPNCQKIHGASDSICGPLIV